MTWILYGAQSTATALVRAETAPFEAEILAELCVATAPRTEPMLIILPRSPFESSYQQCVLSWWCGTAYWMRLLYTHVRRCVLAAEKDAPCVHSLCDIEAFLVSSPYRPRITCFQHYTGIVDESRLFWSAIPATEIPLNPAPTYMSKRPYSSMVLWTSIRISWLLETSVLT